MQNKDRSTRPTLVMVDLLIVGLSLILAFSYRYPEKAFLDDVYYLNMLLFYGIDWIFCTYVFRAYQSYRISSIEKILRSVIQAIFLHVLLVAAFWVLIKGYYYSRQILLSSYLIMGVGILIWRIAFFYFQLGRRKKGYNLKSVIIVGKGDASEDLSNYFIKNPQFGYQFKGFFDIEPSEDLLGNVGQIENYIQNNAIDEIFALVPRVDDESLKELNALADNNAIRLKVIPDIKSYFYAKSSIEVYGNTPVLHLRQYPLDKESGRIIKRIFDIVFSLFIIIFVFSWLFPLIALLIKLESKGSVFYVQERSGLGYQAFKCLKFRSMRSDASSKVFVQATKGDPRITKIGAFIRKTSIDEMPQFFNVLLGDMSVVGPRPHPLKLDDEYKGIVDKYMSRHFVKPGITGLSQVMGYRGETKDMFAMKARVNLDVFYIEHWNFFLDIKIVLLTVYNIFKTEENAY